MKLSQKNDYELVKNQINEMKGKITNMEKIFGFDRCPKCDAFYRNKTMLCDGCGYCPIDHSKATSVRVGDELTKMLSGLVPIKITVTGIDKDYIHCGDIKFDIVNGKQYNENVDFGRVSYLRELA